MADVNIVLLRTHNKPLEYAIWNNKIAPIECFLPNYRKKLWFDRLHKFYKPIGLWQLIQRNIYDFRSPNPGYSVGFDPVDSNMKGRGIAYMKSWLNNEVSPIAFFKPRHRPTDFTIAMEMALRAFSSYPGQVIEAKFENAKDAMQLVADQYKKLMDMVGLSKEQLGFPNEPERGIVVAYHDEVGLFPKLKEVDWNKNQPCIIVGGLHPGKTMRAIGFSTGVMTFEMKRNSMAKRIEAIIAEKEKPYIIENNIIPQPDIKLLMKPLPWQSNGANKGGKKNKRNRKY